MSQYIDTVKLNRGINKDGAYWCQNIRPATDDGVVTGFSMSNGVKRVAATATASLGAIYTFVQIGDSNTASNVVFGKNSDGDIYYIGYAAQSAFKANDYSLSAGYSQGLMLDTNGNLVYTGTQYIGRTYLTTLNGSITASDNTVELTDASNFPTSGYAAIAGAFYYEVIQWTGKSSNQLTGVTRGKYSSTAATHQSGENIYYFKDQWKDLGANVTYDLRRCITWENWNFFTNVNLVTGYSLADASDIKTCLTLAADKTIVDFGKLDTSATSYIIIGANSGENGYLYVWDGKDTATISERELKNNNVTRIWDNFIATDNGIYQYNGTNLELIFEQPEDSDSLKNGEMGVRDMKRVKNYLLVTGGKGLQNRDRKGMWIIDLKTKDSYFILPSSLQTYNGCWGMFVAPNFLFVSNDYNAGAIDLFIEYPASRGSIYQFIYKPTNSKLLQLKRIKLNISTDSKTVLDSNSNVPYFDVVVRGYDYSRPFIRRNQLKSSETPTGSSQLILTNSMTMPEVGDRIEIIDRPYAMYVDSAYAPRNITAVTSATGKYIIDVDDPFPTAIDATTQNSSANVTINPLKKLGKISVNNSSLNLQGYDIPLLSQPRFKKMLFEIEIRCGDVNVIPQLNSMELTYND